MLTRNIDPAIRYEIPDLLCSVCIAADAGVWAHTCENLLNFIPAKKYLLIVPDSDVGIFKSVTDKKFSIAPESTFVPGLKETLMTKVPPEAVNRVGWYLQQFVKLSVLKDVLQNENIVIWEGDAVPLKPINFFRSTGEVEFFTGTNVHAPYFDLIQRLLGLRRATNFSFIGQCFPCKGSWANAFFSFIENKFEDTYQNAILDLIDFKQSSGFSEYETLGAFVYHHYPRQVICSRKEWERNGSALIGGPFNIIREPYKHLIKRYEHLTFEKWEEPFSILKKQSKRIQLQLQRLEATKLQSHEAYLHDIFFSGSVRIVVKVMTNDGSQVDLLNGYLKAPTQVNELLLGQTSRYDESFKKLTSKGLDVTVSGVAESVDNNHYLSSTRSEIDVQFYFANEKKCFPSERESFYGDELLNFTDNLEHYSYLELPIVVDEVSTNSLLESSRNGLLLVINVGRFRVEVFDGIDWLNAPEWIIIQDDMEQCFDYMSFLSRHGYQWIAGAHTKVFSRFRATSNDTDTHSNYKFQRLHESWIIGKINLKLSFIKFTRRFLPRFLVSLGKDILSLSTRLR